VSLSKINFPLQNFPSEKLDPQQHTSRTNRFTQTRLLWNPGKWQKVGDEIPTYGKLCLTQTLHMGNLNLN